MQHEITLTPKTICALKANDISLLRLAALYHMGELDLLKTGIGASDSEIKSIYQVFAKAHPDAQRYHWIYRLALTAYLRNYDLRQLIQPSRSGKIITDTLICATIGTEEVALYLIRSHLEEKESQLIEAFFRNRHSLSQIAKDWQISQNRAREIYNTAMSNIRDRKEGISRDLMQIIFSSF